MKRQSIFLFRYLTSFFCLANEIRLTSDQSSLQRKQGNILVVRIIRSNLASEGLSLKENELVGVNNDFNENV